MNLKLIKDLNIKKKRVFLRADLNVPLLNKKILQDYRLKAVLPSINFIQKNGGKVILATHIGRPKTNFDKNLSTKILLSWFRSNNFKIKLEPDLLKAENESKQNFDEILLLENLRFFDGEKKKTEKQKSFVQKLKNMADLYVNDAFALMHRNDASVTLLPQMFEKENKAFGFLVEKEVNELNKLKNNVTQPFVLVLGGNKISDKTPLLKNFLETKKANRPKTILIGGALAYTFLKAENFNMSNSLVDNQNLEFAKSFLNKAKEMEINVLLPDDHLVIQNATNFQDIFIKKAEAIYQKTEQITQNSICVDIGPETIKKFSEQIAKAKTIFINGSMGIYTEKEFSKGSQKILQAIGASSAKTVAGGGDCIAAIYQFNLQDKFDFLSTGGGATLAFLGTKEPFITMPAFYSTLS